MPAAPLPCRLLAEAGRVSRKCTVVRSPANSAELGCLPCGRASRGSSLPPCLGAGNAWLPVTVLLQETLVTGRSGAGERKCNVAGALCGTASHFQPSFHRVIAHKCLGREGMVVGCFSYHRQAEPAQTLPGYIRVARLLSCKSGLCWVFLGTGNLLGPCKAGKGQED